VRRRFDVTCLGELMIDLVPLAGEGGGMRFAAKPGGAPGNVAVGVARLGLSAAMLSCVGRETFGRTLLDALSQDGVDTSGVLEAEGRSTGLAVVTLDAAGERDFFFYRNGCADQDYAPGDVRRGVLEQTEVLSVGSLFLASPASAAAQRFAVEAVTRAGGRIAADPNFRPPLWKETGAMIAAGREVIAAAHIVKVSMDEARAMAGTDDVPQAAAALWHGGLVILAVTKGAEGAEIYTAGERIEVAGFPVEAVDTVGCGDAFMAALLAGAAAHPAEAPSGRELHELARRACAAGALAAMRAGGMASLPTRAELDAFLAGRPVSSG
jgi:fructokinase